MYEMPRTAQTSFIGQFRRWPKGNWWRFPPKPSTESAPAPADREAIERLRDLKDRDNASPFAIAIKSAEEAIDYVPDLTPLARRLARRCWPGP